MRPIERLVARKGLTLNLLDRDGIVVDPADGFWTRRSSLASFRAEREELDGSFDSLVARAYKQSGPVFTCVLIRMLVFSEARLQFQRIRGEDRGELYDGDSLRLLERPWENATTGDLLSRMEQEGSLAGNAFITPVAGGTRLRRLRPDWVTIVSGIKDDPDSSAWELEADVLGYIYAPKDGAGRPVDPVFLTPKRVVHYAPIPDPAAQWRGMSWLTPVIGEITGDIAATRHKVKFFENGATPSFVVKYDAGVSPEAFAKFVELFQEQSTGVDNAYKVLHLGGGADPTTVGANFKELDFKATQGAGESRIAAASGVGAIMARFSEGMQGSSLNTGNYAAAKRQFADTTLRPLWRSACGSLEKLTACPDDSRLWYDADGISFLQEDQKDSAEIANSEAATIKQLVDAGFTPDSVVTAMRNGADWKQLKHSGLYSVQLQPPKNGTGANDPSGGEPT